MGIFRAVAIIGPKVFFGIRYAVSQHVRCLAEFTVDLCHRLDFFLPLHQGGHVVTYIFLGLTQFIGQLPVAFHIFFGIGSGYGIFIGPVHIDVGIQICVNFQPTVGHTAAQRPFHCYERVVQICDGCLHIGNNLIWGCVDFIQYGLCFVDGGFQLFVVGIVLVEGQFGFIDCLFQIGHGLVPCGVYRGQHVLQTVLVFLQYLHVRTYTVAFNGFSFLRRLQVGFHLFYQCSLVFGYITGIARRHFVLDRTGNIFVQLLGQ